MKEIHDLIEKYIRWLKDKTVLRALNGWVEITTPHLDRHNDYIQIYAKKDNGNILLTDDGTTIQDLEFSGCALDTPKRRAMLEVTLNGFGVEHKGDALQVVATPENFPLKKHSLIQAILAVNDMSIGIMEGWSDEGISEDTDGVQARPCDEVPDVVGWGVFDSGVRVPGW